MEKIIIFAFTFYNDQIQNWKVGLAFTFYDDSIQLWKGIISSPFISICNYFLELSTKLNSYIGKSISNQYDILWTIVYFEISKSLHLYGQ